MVVVNARKFASERLHLFSFIIPFRLNNSAYNVCDYITHLLRRRGSSERIVSAIEIPLPARVGEI